MPDVSSNALRALGAQLTQQLTPDQALPHIAEALCSVPGARRVVVYLNDADGESLAAVAPESAEDDLDLDAMSGVGFPVVHADQPIGRLVIDGELDADTHEAVSAFSRQIGPTLAFATQLRDLQQARGRLVHLREDERRRLRRNLHNSIGPTLAGLNLRVRMIQKLIPVDPENASTQMSEVQTMIGSVIMDIRRVIYDLRPPALDELGLMSAIREQARVFTDDRMSVTVSAPDTPPAVSAAVEVAVYRIVQEALSNVARHANAKTCQIQLSFDSQPALVHIRVEDDGVGLPDGHMAGVGMSTMRELAAELGGRCLFDTPGKIGLRVLASIPF
jgi:two-component system, NarL family, sensor kinase